MKLTALVILVYLCLITVGSVVNQMDWFCDVVCTDSEKEKQPSSDSCPFGICCCNCFIPCYPATSSIQFIEVLKETNKNRHVNEKPMSNYLSDCWHPPEIV